MHSLEMLQRMNSAKVANRERRRAILMNNPGGHAKDVEKGRRRRPRKKGWVITQHHATDIAG